MCGAPMISPVMRPVVAKRKKKIKRKNNIVGGRRTSLRCGSRSAFPIGCWGSSSPISHLCLQLLFFVSDCFFFIFEGLQSVCCLHCKRAQTRAEAATRCSRIPEALPVTTVCRLLSLFAVCLSCLPRETTVIGSHGVQCKLRRPTR